MAVKTINVDLTLGEVADIVTSLRLLAEVAGYRLAPSSLDAIKRLAVKMAAIWCDMMEEGESW